MNQKKTSKKTSLFEPTYSNVSVTNDLRIAQPSTLPKSSSQESNQIKTEHSDFELQKYYENLNQSSNLEQFKQFSSNQLNAFDNQTNLNQPLNDDTTDLKRNYSSYFGIDKLTNYFSSSRPTDAQFDQNVQTYSSSNDLNQAQNVQQSAQQQETQQQQQQNLSSNNMMLNDQNYYQLPKPHWFYKVPSNNNERKDSTNSEKTIYEEQLNQGTSFEHAEQDTTIDENWCPFAFHDSNALEKAYLALESNPNAIVATNGDRYDCYIKDRFRRSVYWNEDDQAIRRCTWYYKKEGHTKFTPYTEQFSNKLEQIYYDVLMNGKWNQRIELNSLKQEMIIFYSYNSIIHYELNDDHIKDEWNTVNESPVKPRTVSRELTIDELEKYDVCLKDDELYEVDHLVFLVHGVGAICDFRLRTIKEVVDDFRKISLELTRTHFRSNANTVPREQKQKVIGRCEFIPVYWHDFLHGTETGIDKRLETITLKSVPKLRAFANDSLLDALFYTSQVYCQHIVNVVSDEINRLYDLFVSRNPYFKGTVSLSGHSLGSVILFDLLANQGSTESREEDISNCLTTSQNKKLTDSLIYSSKTKYHGHESIKYPKLRFKTDCFFALGSPISMFLMLRGFSEMDPHYHLPDCMHVFNIFHPLDPIAYRIEPLINQEFTNLPAVTIPHHKGRKRMHIEIKENLVKVGSEIKDKVLFGIKTTWNSVGSFVGAMPRSSSNLSEIQDQISSTCDESNNEMYDYGGISNTKSQISAGSLNNGERIDYVLQEKPIEFFNQYIFALATHACYWSSEDCVLFMLKELYKLKSVYSTKEPEESSNLNNDYQNTNSQYQSAVKSLRSTSNSNNRPMTIFNQHTDKNSNKNSQINSIPQSAGQISTEITSIEIE